jgi:thiol:disulfide interchange protein DsbD
MKRGLSALMLLSLAGIFAFGQAEEPIVSVKVVPSADVFNPGTTYSLILEVSIRSPYHINSDQPLEDFLIGTTVDFKPRAGVIFKKIAFPPAEIKKLDLSENPMAVYEGTVKVTAEVVLAPDFGGAELVIEGTVGYQACDERSCLPPADAPFRRAVPVSGGAEKATAIKEIPPEQQAPEKQVAAPSPASQKELSVQEQKSQEQKPAEPADAEKEKAAHMAEEVAQMIKKTSASFEGKGIFLTFLLVFMGGLALNLTPCVYPLIPITISYFGGQAQGKKGSIAAHSFLYVIGLAVTYSVLGVVAAFTGSLFGSALQYPPVLIAIAAVMVVLALSMFNVYELRVPAFLSKFAGASKKGFFGTFFMGLTVGIIAAPCIGPFVLGLLTYVGNKGNVLLGFSLFFVLALGLGVPFLLLGIFSGNISRLPRSGAWMVWVRTIFGFVLIAMALYFLKSLFPNGLYYSLAMAVTFLVAGVYMAWLEPTKTAGKAFPFVRNVFGVVFFVFALYVAATGIQGYLDEKIVSSVRDIATAKGSAVEVKAIDWRPYSEGALTEAAQKGRPVFIDFYADWCIPCKEMDARTFSDSEVIAASREFVMLKADMTLATDSRTKLLTQEYAIKGVPTYVFLAPNGKEIGELRLVGFEPKKDFLPRMRRALGLSQK